jgi:hypothetical protein
VEEEIREEALKYSLLPPGHHGTYPETAVAQMVIRERVYLNRFTGESN